MFKKEKLGKYDVFNINKAKPITLSPVATPKIPILINMIKNISIYRPNIEKYINNKIHNISFNKNKLIK